MIKGDFRLLIGLGNPGSKYKSTRHNIGFMALEELAKRESAPFQANKKVFGHIAEVGIGDYKKRLLLPNTFMNDTGRSIRAAMNWYDIPLSQVLILADDIDLPLGRLRLRTHGSSGGHNGLKSVIHHLGTQEFCRLKIGIGSPSQLIENRKAMTVSHVLGSFKDNEYPIVESVINAIIKGLDLIQETDLEKGTSYLNSYSIKS